MDNLEKLNHVGVPAFMEHAARSGYAIDEISAVDAMIWLETDDLGRVDIMDQADFDRLIIEMLLSRAEAAEYAFHECESSNGTSPV